MVMRFASFALIALVGAATASCTTTTTSKRAAAAPAYDTMIVNGRVIDGTGNPWFYADVAIKDGKVAAVGTLDRHDAARVIDAQKHIVAPGFIDVHTHADEDLFELPLAENFTRDGVTTIVTGNCGSSVLEVGKYLDRLTTTTMALNVATLVGHNSVLEKVKGDRAGELTPEQMTRAKAIVDKAMRDGAVGFSTGLIYTPGTYSKTDEIVQLNKVSASHGGIYATHMRDEAHGIVSAIDEALTVARESGSRLEISHLKMPADVEAKIGGSAVTLGKIYQARAEGMEVWVDQYPYTASSTTIAAMLPDWVRADGDEKGRVLLQTEDGMKRMLEDMRKNHEGLRGRKDLSYAVVASSRAFPELAGLNLKEVAQVFKLRAAQGDRVDWKALPREQWPSVNMEEQYRAVATIYIKGGAGMVFHTMNESEVAKILHDPIISVCSDSGVRKFGSGKPHPRGYGSNARVLGRYVREQKVVPLEDAIRKMTGLPATAFRLADRGTITQGKWADIVIFDPATVSDKATFEDPHQYSVGFQAVLVNGVPVVEDDKVTGARPGAALRGPGWHGSPKL